MYEFGRCIWLRGDFIEAWEGVHCCENRAGGAQYEVFHFGAEWEVSTVGYGEGQCGREEGRETEDECTKVHRERCKKLLFLEMWEM